jgi:hypothetical protein
MGYLRETWDRGFQSGFSFFLFFLLQQLAGRQVRFSPSLCLALFLPRSGFEGWDWSGLGVSFGLE